MKVRLLIAGLFLSLVATAQPSNYIKFNTRGRWIAGMFDSTLHVPRFNGSPSLRTGGSSMDGAVAIDTTNNIMYFYSGGEWKRANIDTSAYAVTSVYRKPGTDSVFYTKGGVHTFAFKDSTGGGTPTLQQVLTAGSTLTGGNTIDADGNEFYITNVGDLGITATNGLGAESTIYSNGVTLQLFPNAGLFYIDTINYTLSTTGKKVLIRDTATGLVQNIDPSLLGASSYTFTNGLTDSSGTVKLGGTLTEAITVLDGGVTNNLRFQDMQFEVTTSNTIMLGDSISFTGGSTPNRLSVIKLKNDTIKINPGVGLLYIDTLTSAVGTKALRYNPTTGLVSYADTTTGGSGGTPAGNNRNIQFNSNGAFAGNDSLKFEGGFLKTSNNVPLQIGGVNVINYDNNTNVTTVGGNAYMTTISSGGYTVFGTNSKGAIDHTNGALTLGANIGDSLFTNNGSSHQVGNARFDANIISIGRVLKSQGADVASTAGAMTLGLGGNTFEITGTNSITLLSNVGWQNGSEVTLMFTSTATLVNGTATSGTNITIKLAGATDFVASADDVITLVLGEIGGTQAWREKCRSVN